MTCVWNRRFLEIRKCRNDDNMISIDTCRISHLLEMFSFTLKGYQRKSNIIGKTVP